MKGEDVTPEGSPEGVTVIELFGAPQFHSTLTMVCELYPGCTTSVAGLGVSEMLGTQTLTVYGKNVEVPSWNQRTTDPE